MTAKLPDGLESEITKIVYEAYGNLHDDYCVSMTKRGLRERLQSAAVVAVEWMQAELAEIKKCPAKYFQDGSWITKEYHDQTVTKLQSELTQLRRPVEPTTAEEAEAIVECARRRTAGSFEDAMKRVASAIDKLMTKKGQPPSAGPGMTVEEREARFSKDLEKATYTCGCTGTDSRCPMHHDGDVAENPESQPKENNVSEPCSTQPVDDNPLPMSEATEAGRQAASDVRRPGYAAKDLAFMRQPEMEDRRRRMIRFMDEAGIDTEGLTEAHDPPSNETQVGGNHWTKLKIQTWDYIIQNGLGWCEGNVVKYVTRWQDKGGVDDLRKAQHYLQKLIEGQP